jgi:hypothetical protein
LNVDGTSAVKSVVTSHDYDNSGQSIHLVFAQNSFLLYNGCLSMRE